MDLSDKFRRTGRAENMRRAVEAAERNLLVWVARFKIPN